MFYFNQHWHFLRDLTQISWR